MTLTILMPCLNEAETLAYCIDKANGWIKSHNIKAEVVVADNGSTDQSVEIAMGRGARVIHVGQRGYGSALFHGCMAAHGNWIVMGDSDNSYDFSALDLFIDELERGADLVIGNRFLGGIEAGAMPFKNRYIGNPILSWIGRLLFNSSIRDFHCGLRGVTKDAFLRMNLCTTGMEFATEMIVKASLLGMNIVEVPTKLAKDGRSRRPHLRPWRDGWRHLRFMLLLSPRWLFLIPGLLVAMPCLLVCGLLLDGSLKIGEIYFDIHTLFFSEIGFILGYLSIMCGIIVKKFGAREGLLVDNSLTLRISDSLAFNYSGLVGLILVVGGISLGIISLADWREVKFGALNPSQFFRLVSISGLLLLVGGITFLTSLVLSFLSLPIRNKCMSPKIETYKK